MPKPLELPLCLLKVICALYAAMYNAQHFNNREHDTVEAIQEAPRREIWEIIFGQLALKSNNGVLAAFLEAKNQVFIVFAAN